jgi:hypothetical protein
MLATLVETTGVRFDPRDNSFVGLSDGIWREQQKRREQCDKRGRLHHKAS